MDAPCYFNNNQLSDNSIILVATVSIAVLCILFPCEDEGCAVLHFFVVQVDASVLCVLIIFRREFLANFLDNGVFAFVVKVTCVDISV